MHDDIYPTQIGLLRCLQVLTEEAAVLGLTETTAMLRRAIEACRAENAQVIGQGSAQKATAIQH